MSMDEDAWATFKFIMGCLIVGIILITGGCYVMPQYGVYEQRLHGQAKLQEAEASRQIAVVEAEAKMQAAKSLAQAEVERAKGVAQANKIIADSLKNNESYLRYLWIQGLEHGDHEVIYVPTEAGLPILEAQRLRKK